MDHGGSTGGEAEPRAWLPPASWADCAPLLRELRTANGQPSFTEIARRIGRARRTRGVPAGEATVARVTVYDCFRDDRRRVDAALVADIVRALSPDATVHRQWDAMLLTLQRREASARIVSVSDRLPDETTPFVARTIQLARIRSGDRLWISGMPGAGKSRLAFHGAQQLIGDDPRIRPLMADLRGFSSEGPPADPDAVIDGLLRLLGVPHRDRARSVAERSTMLRDLLVERRHVLILDDAHSLDQVRRILPHPEDATVIVTSRLSPEDLHAAGYADLPLDVLTDEETVELLRATVGTGRIEAEPRAARRLARITSGLPLAVTMTASRIAARPDWSIADHVELTVTRHRSLRLGESVAEAFALSYQALEPAAQTMLRLLALHPATVMDHASALALAGEEVTDPEAALATLRRHHLLTNARPGSYLIHELLRLHAADIGMDTDPPSWRVEAHARLVSDVVSRAWSAYRTRTRLSGELPREPGTDVRLVDLSAQQAEEFFSGCADLLLRLALGGDAAAGGSPAMAISETMGGWLHRQGRFEDAIELHREALRLATETGDGLGRVRAQVDLASALAGAGLFKEAEPLLREIEPMVADHPREEISLQNVLGLVLERGGQADEAAQRLRRAIALGETHGDLLRTGFAWNNLAALLQRVGHLEDARQALEKSDDIGRRVGDPLSVARGAVNLAALYISLGEHAAAERSAREALSAFEEIDYVVGVVVAQSNLAAALRHRHDHPQALHWARAALDGSRAAGLKQHEVTQLIAIAESQLALGSRGQAEEAARAAVALADTIGDPVERIGARTVLGDCHEHTGEHVEARRLWQEAVAIHQETGAAASADLLDRLAR